MLSACWRKICPNWCRSAKITFFNGENSKKIDIIKIIFRKSKKNSNTTWKLSWFVGANAESRQSINPKFLRNSFFCKPLTNHKGRGNQNPGGKMIPNKKKSTSSSIKINKFCWRQSMKNLQVSLNSPLYVSLSTDKFTHCPSESRESYAGGGNLRLSGDERTPAGLMRDISQNTGWSWLEHWLKLAGTLAEVGWNTGWSWRLWSSTVAFFSPPACGSVKFLDRMLAWNDVNEKKTWVTSLLTAVLMDGIGKAIHPLLWQP
jgi:hypothetical protein